jgi:hypothetical protein
VNERQAYALTHPLNDADDHRNLYPLRSVRKHGSGWLIMAILAVDR